MKTIPLFKVFMAESASTEVTKILNSGYIGQGKKVEEFERNMKSFLRNDYVLSLNSGTSAIHLAIHLLKNSNMNWDDPENMGWPGFSSSDEVLTTSLTCTASNWPILANGLKINWVDIDPETLNMDLDNLERKLSPKTKIIMCVHWGGYPNDMDRLKNIQDKAYDLFGFKPEIIEDCAHSFGSTYKGQPLGNNGNMAMYSLQAIKHITSIDGGLLLMPNEKLYKRGKLIRWYGIDRETNTKDFRCEENIDEFGFKFHMNDVCATVGIENLKHASLIIARHQKNAFLYDRGLKNIPGLTLLKRHDDRSSSFWIYSMLVEKRDDFMKYMKECGIMVSQVHERNDKHTCVREFKTFLPTLDKTIGKIISIPVGWWIGDEQIEYIIDCIKKGW